MPAHPPAVRSPSSRNEVECASPFLAVPAGNRSSRAGIGARAGRLRIAIGGLCLLAVAGCANLPGAVPAPPPSPIALELGPGKDSETCFRLAADERIEYQFKSTAALHFNLHTHRGNQIFLPIDIKQTRAQSGFYVSPAAEDYCMMWTNPGAIPAHLEGQWRRIR